MYFIMLHSVYILAKCANTCQFCGHSVAQSHETLSVQYIWQKVAKASSDNFQEGMIISNNTIELTFGLTLTHMLTLSLQTKRNLGYD